MGRHGDLAETEEGDGKSDHDAMDISDMRRTELGADEDDGWRRNGRQVSHWTSRTEVTEQDTTHGHQEHDATPRGTTLTARLGHRRTRFSMAGRQPGRGGR